MTQFYSHTLVRNGQPFIDIVLRQVVPFAEKMLITVSEKSNDGTAALIENLKKEFPSKIEISWENVSNFSDLTLERQKQIDKTPLGKWVLFLDDDDFWPTSSLKNMSNYFDKDVDALSAKPYQVIDQHYYDLSWKNKWFTKWFKNQEGLLYRRPWPADVLFLKQNMLYWKTNKRVPGIPEPYFHLSNIKESSFRNEEWAKKYHKEPGPGYFIPEIYKKDMEVIYGYIK